MPTERTFDLLDRYRDLFTKADALSFKQDGQWITYSSNEYIELSHQFAYGLLEMGLKKGDKVITISSNRPEWNIADMGLAMTALIHVPVFTSLSTAEYLHVIRHSEASLILVSDKKTT